MIDPKLATFAALVRMFLYLGFTMKSSKSSSKLLSGKSVVLDYDIAWSADNEATSSSSEEGSAVASTRDEGSPPFSSLNECDDEDDDDEDSDDDTIDESADMTPTPPFTYRVE